MGYVRQRATAIPRLNEIWLPVLCIVAALSTNTWLVSSSVGYVLSLVALSAVGTYLVFLSDVELRVDLVFLALFGGYWLVLTAGWFVDWSIDRLTYVLITPLTVFVAVFALPGVVDRLEDRRQFVTILTAFGVLVAMSGFAMLIAETVLEVATFPWTGGFVLGYRGYRTSSVFANPNTYGFFMMVCTLTAVFHLADRGPRLLNLTAIVLCSLAVLTSDSTASLLGLGTGVALVLAAAFRRTALVVLLGSVVTAGLLVATGLVGSVLALLPARAGALIDTLFSVRGTLWIASIERLTEDPLTGIGFTNTAAEIAPYVPEGGPVGYGTHNSYINILLQTGFVAGTLYLLAVFYAVGTAVVGAFAARFTPRERADWWPVYVAAVLVAILVAMTFESMTLGGLSLNSVLLALYLGLALSIGGSRIVELNPREIISSR
jgi:hypothetical protein